MITESHTSSGGSGFASLLTVAFIVLKLTGVIAWSWWWVLAPLWIGAVIAAVIIGCAFAWLALSTNRRRRKIRNARREWLAR